MTPSGKTIRDVLLSFGHDGLCPMYTAPFHERSQLLGPCKCKLGKALRSLEALDKAADKGRQDVTTRLLAEAGGQRNALRQILDRLLLTNALRDALDRLIRANEGWGLVCTHKGKHGTKVSRCNLDIERARVRELEAARAALEKAKGRAA